MKTEGLIIIPAYNESNNIARVLEGIRQLDYNLDIVVVDDGSTDGTADVVKNMGETVIRHFYNIGYGGALQTGFKYALDRGYEYVVQFDADGQHDPADIERLVARVRGGGVDIVIGSRFLGSSFAPGFWKKKVIEVFRFLIRHFTGVTVTDPTSGLQALSRRAFENYAAMGNFPEDFPDADTLIWMLRRNYRVAEVPAHIKQRISGQSMHKGLKSLYYLSKMSVSIFVVLVRSRLGERRNTT